jgi:hypothetical protein
MATNKWGVVAEFDSAAAIYHAAEKTTHHGYTRVDAHTPFPVHGLDKALRQGPSPSGLDRRLLRHHGHLPGAADDVVDERARLRVLGLRQGALRVAVDDPDHVRVHGAALRLRRGVRHVRPEPPAASAPPDLPAQHHLARDGRPVLPVHRGDGPQVRQPQTVRFLESIGGKHVEIVED